MSQLLDLFLHIDDHPPPIDGGIWGLTYGILFLVVFCETGLVVTPILPGDSLLFAAGAVARSGRSTWGVLCGILFVAAVLGDTVNYQ